MRATKKYRLSFTEEAKKIVDGLTLEQKVDLMSANFYADKLQELLDSLSSDNSHYNITPYPAGGIEGVIPPMQFCDGPRGVVCGIGKTPCFPVSMAEIFLPESASTFRTIRDGAEARRLMVKSLLQSDRWAQRLYAEYRMRTSWRA